MQRAPCPNLKAAPSPWLRSVRPAPASREPCHQQGLQWEPQACRLGDCPHGQNGTGLAWAVPGHGMLSGAGMHLAALLRCAPITWGASLLMLPGSPRNVSVSGAQAPSHSHISCHGGKGALAIRVRLPMVWVGKEAQGCVHPHHRSVSRYMLWNGGVACWPHRRGMPPAALQQALPRASW